MKEEEIVFPNGGEERKMGTREASVLRYKVKRQSRLFSKRIRYEVRKINAEKRPRMKVIYWISEKRRHFLKFGSRNRPFSKYVAMT